MTTPDTKAIREKMGAMAGFTAGPWSANCPRDLRIFGRMHRVLNPEDYPAAFVPAWDQPEAGQVDGTDEANANARLIAAAPDMRETILALCDALDELRADNERLQTIIGNLHAVEEKHRETANTHFHRANRLQVENERLRAALVEIAHTFTERSDGTIKSCSASFYQEVARAALAQKGGE